MNKRIFQHYKGVIKELDGQKLSGLKAIIDEEDNDVILFWIGVNNDSGWYRIFIDGYYCGVDFYDEDLSDGDLDENIICTDYESIKGDIILSAVVESPNDSDKSERISLSLNLKSGKKLYLYYDECQDTCRFLIVS